MVPQMELKMILLFISALEVGRLSGDLNRNPKTWGRIVPNQVSGHRFSVAQSLPRRRNKRPFMLAAILCGYKSGVCFGRFRKKSEFRAIWGPIKRLHYEEFQSVRVASGIP